MASGKIAKLPVRGETSFFLIAVPMGSLLLSLDQHVAPGRRRLLLAAARTGTIGSCLAVLLFDPVCEQHGSMSIRYLGILFARVMRMLMSLSGFKLHQPRGFPYWLFVPIQASR